MVHWKGLIPAAVQLSFLGSVIWACMSWEHGKKGRAGAVFAVLAALMVWGWSTSRHDRDSDDDREYDDEPRSSVYDR